MSHEEAEPLERLHHLLYSLLRGDTHENQYVGTVEMTEEELERELFHPTKAHYNWLAYWKRHADDERDSEGSWKLRHARHGDYVDEGKQLHITLFRSTENDGWLDVYAHHEYDNVRHPIKHLRTESVSASEGVERATEYFRDHGIDLHDIH